MFNSLCVCLASFYLFFKENNQLIKKTLYLEIESGIKLLQNITFQMRNIKKTLISALAISLIFVSPELKCQNEKAEGYKGLWSAAGRPGEYGYRYSGGLGTSSAQHNPVAIYSSAAQKTYFVYGGTSDEENSHLQIMVSYYDHKTKMVPKPVIVYDKMGVNDPQDNATISIDSDGYIWIFVSGMGRTRPGIIFKSTKSWDLTGFDKIMEGEFVFPQPWHTGGNGFILMFTKFLNGRELYWSTSTDGNTWNTSQKLAAMGGHNQITNYNGKKLVSVFTYLPNGKGEKQTNLYLLQTEDLGKSWKTVDGSIVQPPLTTVKNEALIMDYESEGKLVYMKDLNFDSYGNPVILAIISRDFLPGPGGDPREWMIIHWKDNKWNFNKICQSSHNHDMGSLYINGNKWRVIGSTEPGPQKYGMGGEMALWESYDEGLTWNKSSDITTNSSGNNSYARRPVNAAKGFYSFWADGDAGKLSRSQIYFTDEQGKKVWVLPYSMKNEFEKPVRLK